MPDDSLLSDDDIESEMSAAYVHAVAAHAGYNCGPPPGLDRDSIDIQISCSGHRRPKVDAQLKATINLVGNETHFNYPIKIKNYDDLRIDTQTPRILIVLDLPKSKEEWLLISRERLIIQRSAYWVSLKGLPQTDKQIENNNPDP